MWKVAQHALGMGPPKAGPESDHKPRFGAFWASACISSPSGSNHHSLSQALLVTPGLGGQNLQNYKVVNSCFFGHVESELTTSD